MTTEQYDLRMKVIAFTGVGFFGYLLLAFAFWSLDPVVWHPEVRVMYAVFVFWWLYNVVSKKAECYGDFVKWKSE